MPTSQSWGKHTKELGQSSEAVRHVKDSVQHSNPDLATATMHKAKKLRLLMKKNVQETSCLYRNEWSSGQICKTFCSISDLVIGP